MTIFRRTRTDITLHGTCENAVQYHKTKAHASQLDFIELKKMYHCDYTLFEAFVCFEY